MSNSILFSQKEIEEFSKKVAATLDKEYKGRGSELVLVPLLQGAIPFYSEIIKNLETNCLVDSVGLKSYNGKVQGEFNVYKDFSIDLTRKHVWLIDDIADSGRTLEYLMEKVLQRGAATVNTCTLLTRRNCPMDVDLCGKVVDDEWCVGFGMDDADGLGRTLNNIVAV